MNPDVSQGWWQAADGYWYPAEARPGQLWRGAVCGPHGEQPPGPGWWLASDYQWYPPDAQPGELWADPVGSVPATLRSAARSVDRHRATAVQRTRDDAKVMGLAGAVLIVLSIVMMWGVRTWVPNATDGVRLLAWLPMALGSGVALIGAMRYFGPDR